MNIVTDKEIVVFKNTYDGKEYYSIGLSKKREDGSYLNGYMPCSFRKNVVVENKTKIKIKNSWIDFWLKGKETKPYIFISEFETVGQAPVIEENKEVEVDPYVDFGSNVDLTDSLPF